MVLSVGWTEPSRRVGKVTSTLTFGRFEGAALRCNLLPGDLVLVYGDCFDGDRPLAERLVGDWVTLPSLS